MKKGMTRKLIMLALLTLICMFPCTVSAATQHLMKKGVSEKLTGYSSVTSSKTGVVKVVKSGSSYILKPVKVCRADITCEKGGRKTKMDVAVVSFNKKTVTMKKGTSKKCKLGLPYDVRATWTVSNPAAADLLENGTLVAKAKGISKIKVVYTFGGEKAVYKKKVKVVVPPKKKNFKCNTKKITLVIGKTKTMKVKGIDSATVRYKSSKPSVASVSKKGVIRALKKGKAVITAKVCYRGKVLKTYKKRVTVKKRSSSSSSSSSSGTGSGTSGSGTQTNTVKYTGKQPIPANHQFTFDEFARYGAYSKVGCKLSWTEYPSTDAAESKYVVIISDEKELLKEIKLTLKRKPDPKPATLESWTAKYVGKENPRKYTETESNRIISRKLQTSLQESDFEVIGIYSDGSRKKISYDYISHLGKNADGKVELIVTFSANGEKKDISIPVAKA